MCFSYFSNVARVCDVTAGEASTTTKKRLEDFMEEPMRKTEVIALSRYPDSHKREEEQPLPIERDDWPAPAATAAAFPELRQCARKSLPSPAHLPLLSSLKFAGFGCVSVYSHKRRSSSGRHRSGESSERNSVDGRRSTSLDPLASGDVTSDGGDDEDDENDVTTPNAVLQKDIEHLSRLENTSGAAKVILEELKKEAAKPAPLLDVISASRTPSASKEPHYKTRYESHVFACE